MSSARTQCCQTKPVTCWRWTSTRPNWQDCACAVTDVCPTHEIPFALERSRSGQGAHLWLFFAEAIELTERQGFSRVMVLRFLRFAMPVCTEKATYGKIREALVQNALSNDLITQDARCRDQFADDTARNGGRSGGVLRNDAKQTDSLMAHFPEVH